MALATDISNIQTDINNLAGHVDAFLLDGGSATTLVYWLVNQIKGFDEKTARALILNGSRYIGAAYDNRALADFAAGQSL
jgi:hypothetical protein